MREKIEGGGGATIDVVGDMQVNFVAVECSDTLHILDVVVAEAIAMEHGLALVQDWGFIRP